MSGAAATPGTSGPIPLDLLAAGDPRFVAALRGVADAAALARFAGDWFADRRPGARGLLLAYLDEPPNAPGHEGLARRLFQRAEAAADDEVMARFLVLADRLIVRRSRDRLVTRRRRFATAEEARAREAEWAAEGWVAVARAHLSFVAEVRPNRHLVVATRRVRRTTTRGTTLPRPDWRGAEALAALTDEERAGRRWFSVATRRHLGRRAWRYFRALGRADPARYVAAAEAALGRYRDAELGTGRALLDHPGLMRLLFDRSPALRFRPAGCVLAPGHDLAGLAPAPAFEAAWRDRPAAVLRALAGARSRLVARWATRWIEADRAGFLAATRPADWADLLGRPDPAVVALAGGMLAAFPADRARREVPPAAWVAAIEAAPPAHRGGICALAARLVAPADVPRAAAVRLALGPDEPTARLGWGWIAGRGADRAESGADGDAGADPAGRIRELFPLADAACAALRPAILDGIGRRIAAGSPLRVEWARALLDARHADARAAGRAWLAADPAVGADPTLWGHLAASPAPDVQALVATAPTPPPIDPARRDAARAAVLLRPTGQARAKPAAIRGVVARLDALPADATLDADAHADAAGLLDLLAAVARSAHAPERRAALAALVALADRRPAWAGRIEAAVPALQLGGGPAILPA